MKVLLRPVKFTSTGVGLILILLHAVPAGAQVVFDNGVFNGGSTNIRNSSGQYVYEDFTLNQSVQITGVTWTQHDLITAYDSTDILFYNDIPSATSLVATFNVMATRTPNSTGALFTTWLGFDYSASSLSLTLAPGTYWIGLYNNVTGTGTGWDTTSGTSATIANQRISNSSFPLPGGNVYVNNSAFQLLGTAVPEPATYASWSGLAALALAFVWRRSKKHTVP